jgi:hypothetical protein
MNTLDLLQAIRERGVSIRLQGEQLIFKPGHMVKDLADELRKHKTSIMQQLECGQCVYHQPPMCVAVASRVMTAQEVHKPECWLFLESKTVH